MRRSGISIMGSLIGLVRPLLFFMLLAILMGTAGYLCAIFLTVAAMGGVLQVLGFHLAGWPAAFGGLLLGMAFLAVFRGIFHYFEQECNHFIAFKLLAVIRHQVFDALRRLCPAKLEGRDRGNLISVITSDIELLEVFYAHTISPAAIALLTSLIMVWFIGRINLACGLLALVGYGVVGVVFPLWNGRRGGQNGMDYREAFGEMNSFILDSLRGLREIIQFGQGINRLARMDEGSRRLSEKTQKLRLLEGSLAAVTGTFISLFSFGMLYLTMWLYAGGRMGFDSALLVTAATISSFGPVAALSSLSNNLNQTLACGERVLAVLEEDPQVEEIGGRTGTLFTGAACEQVGFSYGDEQILKAVTIHVTEQKILGIHGKSGSGKSTFLKLFMRFWDVQGGKVLISGKDIRKINTKDLRNMEGLVTQETVLFHTSIADNIAVGKPGAAREEIIEAAKKASVHTFIESLPKGYDTPVGELGDSLSGGERQRIGIARAFLHDAPLLLLDEPTSNLDSLNEGIILKSLREEKENRTVILVSHRPSTMNIADEVFEMGEGRIS